MKRKIDIVRAITTFQVVLDLGSFSKAADQLGIVVSAVSKQVSELEKHFGCQLLHRTTRAMNLTAEGEHYLEQFNLIVDALENLEGRADINQRIIAGHLRISAPPNAEQLGITRLIGEFLHQHPAVKITLILLNRYINLVEEGVDLAIRVHELSDSRLIARNFTELNVLYVASPDYLEKYGTPQHPKELTKHNCILDSSIRTPCRWRYFEGNNERHVNVTGTIEVNYGNITAEYSAAGHGIAFLPDFLVQDYINIGKLLSTLEPFHMPATPVSLVYPANRMQNPVLREMVQYLLNNKPKRIM
ncbi:LysR family transcriptional regulator [Psychrobacter fozii]|uniref:LysR family transcriptional regulator n=1 Tax=Psychrobacter fozii TaxID=198480 RepID=UPI001918DFCC|nr:LysR family transcriptional regulator [Psychrobacter fozii]